MKPPLSSLILLPPPVAECLLSALIPRLSLGEEAWEICGFLMQVGAVALRVTGTFPAPPAFQEQLALRPSLDSESKPLHERIPGHTLKSAQLPRAGKRPGGASPRAPVLEVYTGRGPGWVGDPRPPAFSAEGSDCSYLCPRIGRPGLGGGGSWRGKIQIHKYIAGQPGKGKRPALPLPPIGFVPGSPSSRVLPGQAC